ncbi:MAG TPA: type II toxin-antitoxin system RelE/ParE family toxin [Desulfomonilaceae bacterium]|nr:type II toxin-antitoxin system RelE/ParE family toxin [Desulfomonilaceae bacterium]
MKHSFHPEALEEYLGAVSYYADISPQLAESFIKSFESGIEEIGIYPEAWRIVEEDVRRYLIKRFPFGIYYCIEGDRVMIYAVMHMSRDPKYWTSRIKPG